MTCMMKERTAEVTKTRCGRTLPTKGLPATEVTIWESRVSCPGCELKPQGSD